MLWLLIIINVYTAAHKQPQTKYKLLLKKNKI